MTDDMNSTPTPARGSSAREHQHDDTYGKSFALYDQASFREFVDFHAARFTANGLDARSVFAGKQCLDAGCGTGRGSLFMADAGAARIDSFDISPRNVETTAANLAHHGFADISAVQQGSIEALPYADGQFDVVWCNGVIMHTANPDACLCELARVLKPGGQCWIYVYGVGGLYWYWVVRARAVLYGRGAETCLQMLTLLGLTPRYIGEYMDNWTVPYLRAYRHQDFGARLRSLGFEGAEPLQAGVSYDTNVRLHQYPQDRPWMGEGDLRYFMVKGGKGDPDAAPLPETFVDESMVFDPAILDMFGPLFDDYDRLVREDPQLAVTVSANIQRRLRDLMTQEGAFPVEAFRDHVTEMLTLAGEAVRLRS